ncbi:hypothetical protein EH223_15150 [candidate division KSB1 bacterium]|nr:endonuclease/exonuclease/phosphatase family protein [candidate division KSB1 bacterium]RQW01252.1 MAG: hypothetical protein EH223_15150 [candidate division KSB1 bacterium]
MHKFVLVTLVLTLVVMTCTTEQNAPKKQTGYCLISYNVWYGFTRVPERKPDWLLWMQEQAPDFVALQELNGYDVDQLKEDARQWGHDHSVLLKEDGFPTGLTSRFPIQDVKIYRDGFHHGLLRATINRFYFYVIHLHPSNWQFRHQEISRILADIRSLPKNASIFLVGDFNTFSRHDSLFYAHGRLEPFFQTRDAEYNEQNLKNGTLDYTVLDQLMNAGFIDLEFSQRGQDYQFTGSFPTKIEKPGDHGSQRRLDYVFATANLAERIIRADIVADERTWRLSDHLPMLVVFE